jgi:hypothetical protein
MRKIIQACTFLLIGNLMIEKAQAQLPKALLFGNFTYANPTNASFKNISNYGAGFELGGGIGFGKTILMASAGQMRYNVPNAGHINVTPLKLGIRRYILLGLFLNGNLGMAMQKYNFTNQTKNSFLYEAGAGYKLGFFEVGAAFTGYPLVGSSGNANSLLLKAGLAIKI